MTNLTAVRGDITRIRADAIVNAANSMLRGGGGVDGAIHRTGGPLILEAGLAHVAANGPLATGRAVTTGAGTLPAEVIIHTVGPIYANHEATEAAALLADCYTASLDVAVAQGCRSVAFPNISTGVYGFPKPAAASVALGAVRAWVEDHDDVIADITFVCFDQENHDLYTAALGAD